MDQRTPAEVGAIVRARRTQLGFTQDGLEGVSSATVGKIERGTGSQEGQALTRKRLARALGWRLDAFELLYGGADPSDVIDWQPTDPPSRPPTGATPDDDAIQIAALAGKLTPEARAKLEGYARALLDQQAEGGN